MSYEYSKGSQDRELLEYFSNIYPGNSANIANNCSEFKEVSSNHSKGEDDEEALEPEDDVIEEVHLSLVQYIFDKHPNHHHSS